MIENLSKRLTEKEYNELKKIYLKVNKMNAFNEEQRTEILNYVMSQYPDIVFNLIESEKETIVYRFKIGGKDNFLVFDRFGNEPPNIIPAGMIILGEPPSN